MIDFDRLEEANRPLGAFTDFDRSADFGKGPLTGVTVGVKANIAVRGQPWTAGMSRWKTESTISEPTPGQANSFSTTTAWPISEPNCRPTMVITSTRALRRTCHSTTRRSLMPLLRAVRTKSALRTSSTAARVVRASSAIGPTPSATAGRIRLRRPPSP